jgi:hypothetical protein
MIPVSIVDLDRLRKQFQRLFAMGTNCLHNEVKRTPPNLTMSPVRKMVAGPFLRWCASYLPERVVMVCWEVVCCLSGVEQLLSRKARLRVMSEMMVKFFIGTSCGDCQLVAG